MSLALKNLKCHSAASLGAFLAPQDDQLTSEHCIVCLKPALRLERRGQHGQNKPNQRDHRASLADSVTRKIRIRFRYTHPVALAMQVVRKDLSITSLAKLEAAAILTVSLLRAFFDRRINPAAKVSYPWGRPRPG